MQWYRRLVGWCPWQTCTVELTELVGLSCCLQKTYCQPPKWWRVLIYRCGCTDLTVVSWYCSWPLTTPWQLSWLQSNRWALSSLNVRSWIFTLTLLVNSVFCDIIVKFWSQILIIFFPKSFFCVNTFHKYVWMI